MLSYNKYSLNFFSVASSILRVLGISDFLYGSIFSFYFAVKLESTRGFFSNSLMCPACSIVYFLITLGLLSVPNFFYAM